MGNLVQVFEQRLIHVLCAYVEIFRLSACDYLYLLILFAVFKPVNISYEHSNDSISCASWFTCNFPARTKILDLIVYEK